MPHYTVHIRDDVFYMGVEAESKDEARLRALDWFDERIPIIDLEEELEENEDEEE